MYLNNNGVDQPAQFGVITFVSSLVERGGLVAPENDRAQKLGSAEEIRCVFDDI